MSNSGGSGSLPMSAVTAARVPDARDIATELLCVAPWATVTPVAPPAMLPFFT